MDFLTIHQSVNAQFERAKREGTHDTIASTLFQAGSTATGAVDETADQAGGGGTITTRAFCFMAVGGSIGAGLFVASGSALQKGGPAAVVVAFLVLGLAVWLTMCALGELAASVPASGSFYGYSVRFVGESWGFAMGWNYVLNFVLVVAFEMTVIVMLAQYWRPGLSAGESRLFLVALALLPLLALHILLGGKGYSEAEMGFSVVKVSVLALFMITAVVIATGGTPEAGGQGFANYSEYASPSFPLLVRLDFSRCNGSLALTIRLPLQPVAKPSAMASGASSPSSSPRAWPTAAPRCSGSASPSASTRAASCPSAP